MEDITKDYPTDEKTLLSSFPTKATAKEYMMFHWDNFVTKDDIFFLSEVAKVEYVRVPLPHYVMNDILDDEPWVDGQWLYFVRFVVLVLRSAHSLLTPVVPPLAPAHQRWRVVGW